VVVVLAATGLLLNHVDDLAWMKGRVHQEAVLDWYGVAPEGEIVHFSAGRFHGASLDQGLYLDGRLVAAAESPLIGVVVFRRFLVLGMERRLIVVDPALGLDSEHDRIVDQMDSASLPGALRRVGLTEAGQLAVESQGGVHVADADLLGWREVGAAPVVAWSVASTPPARERDAILRAYRGAGLPRTRVIADLHSGRIFGRYGPALVDASAVLLVLLVVTGIMGSGLGRRRGIDD